MTAKNKLFWENLRQIKSINKRGQEYIYPNDTE